MDSVKVWIVEDDKDWLRGLSAYLGAQAGIEVTFTADNPESVRQALERTSIVNSMDVESAGAQDAMVEESSVNSADVVLMDIMLNGVPAGIGLAEEVATTIGARVIMLTSMEEKDLIFRSFQAGAIDYQIKSDYVALPDAIKAAARRESPISSAAADRMREEFRRLKRMEREFEAKKMQDLITPSELELLKLIDKGYTQTEIAGRLVVSIRTVKNHINHILKKLGSKGSKEAAQEAKEKGLF
ncbi:response regulator transcription factor [Cohnella herbarum]|uniref:Response regulator transcription factor n=1 Tax=Cohnella herbarum TaxID=2728023 RepID=A0A7Z2VFE4_9BACL|nr:response regulator transcription factor [Cohnella herbarum]QJD82158.1 response regulator transcription factor [Cohnella herbarum]